MKRNSITANIRYTQLRKQLNEVWDNGGESDLNDNDVLMEYYSNVCPGLSLTALKGAEVTKDWLKQFEGDCLVVVTPEDSSEGWQGFPCYNIEKDDEDLSPYLENYSEDTLIFITYKKLKKVFIPERTSKGELIIIAYNKDLEKLKKVDVALPEEWLRKYSGQTRIKETFLNVMDYNVSIFGQIRYLPKVARENGLELEFEYDFLNDK